MAQQADQGERRNALAAAGFADQAKSLTAIDAERHVLERRDPTGSDIEIDAQVLDFDQGRARHVRRLRDCGSRMSRRPSPSRLRPSTVRKMASPGKTESHGAVVIWSRASDSMLPQLGKGGRIPRPRNERAASASTAPPMPSVPMTMIGPIMFGNNCVNMMRKSP